jgi:hypothetical protein
VQHLQGSAERRTIPLMSANEAKKPSTNENKSFSRNAQLNSLSFIFEIGIARWL